MEGEANINLLERRVQIKRILGFKLVFYIKTKIKIYVEIKGNESITKDPDKYYRYSSCQAEGVNLPYLLLKATFCYKIHTVLLIYLHYIIHSLK